MAQRCLILIDGSNFYFKLKDLKINNLLDFNFSEFAKFLSRSGSVVESKYYVGRIRQDGSTKINKMHASQQVLFTKLKKHNFKYVLGYLLESSGRYHEKGVDVHIAVDMLIATYEDKVDKIILVSSDTDLEPAIRKAKEKGKTIEYIGFSHKASVAMVRFCSESRLLTKEELVQFIDTAKSTKKGKK